MAQDLAAYEGRSVDLALLQGLTGAASGPPLALDLAADGGSGEAVAGVWKFAQRWLLRFQTELGSKRYSPDDGCAFFTRSRSGLFANDADVAGAFGLSAIDVARQLRAEETDDDPDDERYGSVTLQGTLLTPGVLRLDLKFVSRAGDSAELLLPVPVLV